MVDNETGSAWYWGKARGLCRVLWGMDVVIIGTGGFGREVLNYALDAVDDGWKARIIGWVDDCPSKHHTLVHDLPVLGNLDWLNSHPVSALLGVGSPRIRASIDARLPGQTWGSLRHPTAYVGRRVAFGAGALLCPGACITTDIEIGRHFIANLNATVGHDSRLGDYVTLAPGVHISGNVQLGDCVDVGSGAALNPGVRVGHHAIIGSAAAVTRDIAAQVTAVGVPARARLIDVP